MFENQIYDIVRDWIKDQRRDNVSWEDLYNGEGDLKSLLSNSEKFHHWPHLEETEWQQIVNQQKTAEEQTLQTQSQNESATIHDDFQENAVSDIPRGRHSAWQTYKRKLQSKGFKDSSIDEIETASFKLIKRLSRDTTETGTRKGLVIGNVQSGKTANMAALMAMAADWGWNMFIVLSGTIENLRRQTQNRLFGDLYDAECNLQWWCLDKLRANMSKGERAEFKNFNSNNRYMTLVLKNATRLKNLIKWLQEDPNTQSHMRILVIDDEADQAGINTANIKTNVRKTINNLICALINGNDFENKPIGQKYKAMNYIAYTATPYANVLNEHGVDSTYPRNFISALSVSKEYFGPQQVFGCEDTQYDGLNIVRCIPQNELNEIKNIHDGQNTVIPTSLKEAVCWFMCCVACHRHWNKTKPVSMLVHTSQKTNHHDRIAHVINEWISKTPETDIINECQRTWETETARFDKELLREQYPDYDCADDEIPTYPDFESIKEQLKILLRGQRISNIPLNQEDVPQYHDGIHLCIDNCKNNGTTDGMIVRLMYPEAQQDIARAFIVVGGQTLSRGLTIEGLVSTYFLRAIKQADTLMQMGRWFGYRKGYETLPRIWMTDRIKEQFEFLSVLDMNLREEIKRMENLGIAPEKYGPRVKEHPQVSLLRITAKNRMQEGVDTDYSGLSSQTIIFDNDQTLLEENLNATKSFLASLPNPEDHKACNAHSAYSTVWRNVELDKVRGYLEGFHFSQRQTAFNDIKRMMQWFENLTQRGKINKWNVVLAGIDPTRATGKWSINDSISVAKVCRTQKKNHHEGILNIGTLRGPKDILADIDLEGASNILVEMVKNFDSKNAMDIRNMAGLGKTPQLLIYIVDKDSQANPNLKSRESLHAAADVVGLCINVPEDRQRSNTNTVAIPIDENMFDYIEDIDGTDED